MGKPFKKELESIEAVYHWACNVNITELKTEIEKNMGNPLLVVGSGGSLSACYFATKLHQNKGQISKAVTPLELLFSKKIINNCSILFLSASGRNTDILSAFKNSASQAPVDMFGLTFSTKSPLYSLASKLGYSSIYHYDNPVGKDGFLATNSLIAFFVLLYRCYENLPELGKLLFDNEYNKSLATFKQSIEQNFTYKILYGDWSLPVAIDIESKFSEAALGNILLSDYRNFGHGRHNWLDKRGNNTAIIALITPDDKDLAEKTLSLVPINIPILRIESTSASAFAAIELLIKSYYLVEMAGDLVNIDPGRPGVPEYGSKLYHLKYSQLLKQERDSHIHSAIQKKLGVQSYYALSQTESDLWQLNYTKYIRKITDQKYKTIVFDYDGTLCYAVNRFTGLDQNMADILNSLLENNIIVGVATGRGKSVKSDLRKVIKEEFWHNVIIGYYNGSEVGTLVENHIPDSSDFINPLFEFYLSILTQKFGKKIVLESRKKQLTISINGEGTTSLIDEIIQFIYIQNKPEILCVQSDHSIDVIMRPDVSKLNVIRFIELKLGNNLYKTLTLGDKGKYPGNDFELLSHPYSLSVDEVSTDADSCWNLSNTVSGVDATFFYLKKLKIFNGYFKLKL